MRKNSIPSPIYLSTSSEDTISWGKRFSNSLSPNDIVAMEGELGAGKTTLAKGIVEGLGGKPAVVCSPTYVYLHIYEAKIPVFHFDLYRLQNVEEFIALGFEEYFNMQGICLIEWSERIASLLPQNARAVYLTYAKNEMRQIRYDF